MIRRLGASATAAVLIGGLIFGVSGTGVQAMTPPDVPISRPAEFPKTVTASLTPGSYGYTGSAILPDRSRNITVTVARGAGTTAQRFARMYTALSSLSNNRRLMFCASIYGIPAIVEEAGDLGGVFLGAVADPMRLCLQIVANLAAANRQGPTSRAKACSMVTLAVPVTTTVTNGVVAVTPTGDPRLAAKSSLKVTCRDRGGNLTLKLVPRSKKKTLTDLLGSRVTIGYGSPADTDGTINLSLRYGVPR